GRRIAELGQLLERLAGKLEDIRRQEEEFDGRQPQEAELEAARAAVTAAEAEVAQASRAAEDADERLTRHRSAESGARDALHAAEAEVSRLSAEIEGLSRLLKPAESDMWPPLIDAVRVSEGLEKAIGAALGDDLD